FTASGLSRTNFKSSMVCSPHVVVFLQGTALRKRLPGAVPCAGRSRRRPGRGGGTLAAATSVPKIQRKTSGAFFVGRGGARKRSGCPALAPDGAERTLATVTPVPKIQRKTSEAFFVG